MTAMLSSILTPRGQRLAVVAGAGLVALAAPVLLDPAPRLVWNATDSAPIGLYQIAPGAAPRVGDHVLVWPPQEARALAARRGYLPFNVPMIKTVAAMDGALVCGAGAHITIDGKAAVLRRATDRQGRSLPWWSGCERLSRHRIFLINPAPDSFDGRYFGPADTASVIGRATPLWLP